SYLGTLGGSVETGHPVRSLADLPPTRAVLFDLTPRQLLAIVGDHLDAGYRDRLLRFRYGPGSFKVDYALDGPVPWRAPEVVRAGSVHLGGTMGEIARAEAEVARGGHPCNPYVLVTQTSLFDPSRAPEGKHTLWAYCHVPNGSTVDMTEAIEHQIERFAPGFRDRVLARHVMGTAAIEAHNPNYIGGDIAGGSHDALQLLARPVLTLHPYDVPLAGMHAYLCSSSTPPGAGVHGMCGWWAAQSALKALGDPR
ncbi:MAG: phytoene desaturase family protein, partial [Actinomycetota bacterium]